jgi:two-component system chemotaxis response regulator CheB
VVQDHASAIVPGMPDAARRVAGADAIATLNDMAAVLVAQVEGLPDFPALQASA